MYCKLVLTSRKVVFDVELEPNFKKIAEVMGHRLETHLLSYARFDSKDLANSFDQVPTQLEFNPII